MSNELQPPPWAPPNTPRPFGDKLPDMPITHRNDIANAQGQGNKLACPSRGQRKAMHGLLVSPRPIKAGSCEARHPTTSKAAPLNRPTPPAGPWVPPSWVPPRKVECSALAPVSRATTSLAPAAAPLAPAAAPLAPAAASHVPSAATEVGKPELQSEARLEPEDTRTNQFEASPAARAGYELANGGCNELCSVPQASVPLSDARTRSRRTPSHRLFSGSARASAPQPSLPPECTERPSWQGTAAKRYAKFKKKQDPNAKIGSEDDLKIPNRKPLYPKLWLKVPKAIASTTLVLRKDYALESEMIGNLEPGIELYIMETREVSKGNVRACVADTPLADRDPLGWVTMIKDHEELVTYVEYETAMPVNARPEDGFFTSCCSSRRLPSAERSMTDGKMSPLQSPEGDAPQASWRRGIPSPTMDTVRFA